LAYLFYYYDMKFLVSVIDDLTNSGTPKEMAAIDAFNEKLRDNGHWIFARGLQAPETATVIDNRAGIHIETGEPLFDSREHYSGLWLIEATDLESARALAFEASEACNRRVELRPLH
jgi:hypothetical protein